MAVNKSRSMSEEFTQGSTDSTYISLVPDRGGVLSNIPSERMSWPVYGQADMHMKAPFACDPSCHDGKVYENLR
ncbi:MAG: hypothetical protein EBR40_09080 [Proteobacteria bacterium]|nr:hypothetical protein [Pseudomonadota bacterium]